jgi:hypothetical protein
MVTARSRCKSTSTKSCSGTSGQASTTVRIVLLVLAHRVLVREVGGLVTLGVVTLVSDSRGTQAMGALGARLLGSSRGVIALVVKARTTLVVSTVIIATTIVRSESSSTETSGSTAGSTSGNVATAVRVDVLLAIRHLGSSARRGVGALGVVVTRGVETSGGVLGSVLSSRRVLVSARSVVATVVIVVSVPRSSVGTCGTGSAGST